MSKSLVFINQATGYLTVDIINEFAKEFDELVLITGSIRIQNTKLNPKVKIENIIRYNRGNNLRKALSWFLGTIQIYQLLKFKYKEYERFFFTIPPTAYLLALNLKYVYSIAVYDLYPEALKSNGFSEKRWIYRWWAKRNRQIFSKAHRVFTLSENMKSQVLEYSTSSNVRVISNWTAFSGFTPIEKDHNNIRKREGYFGRFIVQYSGNIGVTHNVETLVEVAEKLKSHPDLVFQIIGRGERSNEIRDLIKTKGLTNCKLLPFRSDLELYESLCSADLAVITLDNKTSDISVPSKLYNIMAAGVPGMVIASLTSEISHIVLQHQMGKAFEKENVCEMCKFILELKSDRILRNKMSENSLLASQYYSNTNAAKYLEYYYK